MAVPACGYQPPGTPRPRPYFISTDPLSWGPVCAHSFLIRNDRNTTNYDVEVKKGSEVGLFQVTFATGEYIW